MALKGRVLDILGHEVYVEYGGTDESNCGEAYADNRLILINPKIPHNTQVETFYHEIVHLILSYGGHSEWLDEKKEETLCQYLGFAIAQLISSNKNLPKLKKSK